MSATRSLHNANWLTSGPAARVLGLLNSDGEEARVVGGAVRNALLGLPVDEIDIATTAVAGGSDQPREAGSDQERADWH